jgi:NADH dehydrogenase
MATISRFSAVAAIGSLRFTGLVAWVLWLAVHLVYIIGFKHRLTTLLHWAVSFLGRGRSERTVTEQQVFARTAIEQLGAGYAPSLPRVPADKLAAPQSVAQAREEGSRTL